MRSAAVDDSRLFFYLLFNFLHRADYRRRRQYGDNLDLAVIAEAIAIAAIDPRMRESQFRREYLSLHKIVGIDGQRSVNALSIAAATSIPRETARRKIKRLVELGIIVETSRGNYVMTPGYLQSPSIQRMLEGISRETIRFINDCLDNGVLHLSRRVADD